MGVLAAIAGVVTGLVGIYRLFGPGEAHGAAWLVISAILISGAAIAHGLYALERAVRDERDARETLRPARKVSRGVRLPTATT